MRITWPATFLISLDIEEGRDKIKWTCTLGNVAALVQMCGPVFPTLSMYMYMWSHKSRHDCVHVRTNTCKSVCFQVFSICSSMTMKLVFVDIHLRWDFNPRRAFLTANVSHGVGGGPFIGLCHSTGSHSMCVNIALFCVGMWLWEAASHWNRSKVVGKMAKGWINNNIVRRSCCVHHVSTGVEHNSCDIRPEDEECWKDSCYNTWRPDTTHGHQTQHMDTRHNTWTPHMYTCTVHTNTLIPLIIEC